MTAPCRHCHARPGTRPRGLCPSGPLVPLTETAGDTSSSAGPGSLPRSRRKRLSPYFVEWMMGWPPGWTSTTALTGSGRAAMASYLSRQQRLFQSLLAVLD